ncbi:MAG: PEGA domain-containing protein, partial [Acidobacteriota bacterium]
AGLANLPGAAAVPSGTEVVVAAGSGATPVAATAAGGADRATANSDAGSATARVMTSGPLVIRSQPAGALVRVDGRMVGATPTAARDLPAGAHVLLIARPGYAPRSENVVLAAASPARLLNFDLEPGVSAPVGSAYGSIDIDSAPRGARVIVDGRFIGHSPLRLAEQRPGTHAVTLELGRRSVTRHVAVDAARTSRLTIVIGQ